MTTQTKTKFRLAPWLVLARIVVLPTCMMLSVLAWWHADFAQATFWLACVLFWRGK